MCWLPPLPIVVRHSSRSAPPARPVSARSEVTSHHLALHLVLDPHLVTCHHTRSAGGGPGFDGNGDRVRLDFGLLASLVVASLVVASLVVASLVVAGLVVASLGLALCSALLFRWLPGSATWS